MGEDEEKPSPNTARILAEVYLGTKERKRKQRKQKEKQITKEIEESKSQNLQTRSELLGEINEKLTDFALSEEWWNSIRTWLENACSANTENVVVVLSRLDSKNWRLTGLVNSKKNQKRLVLQIGPQEE